MVRFQKFLVFLFSLGMIFLFQNSAEAASANKNQNGIKMTQKEYQKSKRLRLLVEHGDGPTVSLVFSIPAQLAYVYQLKSH